MRISDWSSDVCSSDLGIGIRSALEGRGPGDEHVGARGDRQWCGAAVDAAVDFQPDVAARLVDHLAHRLDLAKLAGDEALRSEEHTSELQSLMRISYAVFCLKKKNTELNCNNEDTYYKHT